MCSSHTWLQLYESEWKTRRSVIWTIAPGKQEHAPSILFDRNYEDAYSGNEILSMFVGLCVVSKRYRMNCSDTPGLGCPTRILRTLFIIS